MATADLTRPDDALVHPLDRLRGSVRRYVLADGLLTAGLFLLAWFWLGLAADFGLFKLTAFDWVLDAPKLLRVVALLGLAGVFAAIVVTRLVRRLRTEFSYPSLALVLEKRFPHVLGDKLITAVELADVDRMKGYGFSEEMIRATIAEARERVGTVDVDSVFDWARLRRHAIVLAVAAVGGPVLAFAGTSVVAGPRPMQAFARQFGDVAAVWGERNLLLRDTPWPRAAHLVILSPDRDDLRIGKDAAAPRVRARAFRWVFADRNSPDGWRPLLWSDLADPRLAVAAPPPPGLPADADADRVEAAAGEPMRSVFARLEELAAKPRLSRTLRKLDIPEAVTLSYSGSKTRGGLTLNREANNEFAGDVAGLKENVRYVVKGADFSTRPRSITLVPPPALARLTRTEYQPAYLYHPPPVRDQVAANAPRQEFADLKGLRQLIGEKDLSLTGDKSVFSIVQGTEFELTGTAVVAEANGEKTPPLAKVMVRPKVGKLPGLAAGSSGPLELTPSGPDADRFTLSFRGPDRPTGSLEFELVLVDKDDVTSTRTILVQVTEDQPPQVDLAVDALRKQGNTYLVTPIVRVPFLTESKVRDDTGLAKLEYVFSYTQVEAQIVVGVQAQALAGVWANAPAVPGIGSLVGPAASAVLTQAITRPEQRASGAVPVPKFIEAFAQLAPDTTKGLADKLGKPADPDKAQVVKEIKFNNQDLDAFDLGRAVPALLVKDATAIQPRYRVEVNLVATDANVESGPKTGQSLEPVRLLVVSEAELLAEISKDEEALAAKLDEVLKKLRDAQTNLSQTADRLVGSPPPDVIVTASVRAQSIALDVGKSRDVSGSVLGEFRRLNRESLFNGVQEKVQEGQTKIIRTLDGILENAYPAAEEAHKAVIAALAEGRKPDETFLNTDRAALAELIRQMAALRDMLGEAVSLNKIRDSLRKLIDDERQITRVMKRFYDRALSELYDPDVVPIPAVELAKGQTLTVKHKIEWKAFTGNELKIRLSGAPQVAVAYPAEVTVQADVEAVEYTLKAGQKSGTYNLTLTPSAGKPVEVKVTVK